MGFEFVVNLAIKILEFSFLVLISTYKSLNMHIALVQSPLVWEDKQANLDYFSEIFETLPSDLDLIILPEMFTSGFTMQPHLVACSMDGLVVRWMQSETKKRQAALMGSVVMEENGKFYNRLLFVNPEGAVAYYDKKHLFSLAGEHQVYESGTQKLIIRYRGWNICPLICYDLRFPVFSRNKEGYDLLVYVANWPEIRTNAWDILLKARAVENMSYVVGVNRVGEDGAGHRYIGHSQVIDFLGNEVLPPQKDEAVFYVKLDKEKLIQTREKLNFLEDQDDFEML
jgi:predicted amidohydrolase